jgi:predicted RNA-binding Zn-ribbon protein involved in translation (DUF1610 family)
MSVSALVWAKPDTVTALQREADAVKWQRSYIRWFCPTCGEWGIFEDAPKPKGQNFYLCYGCASKRNGLNVKLIEVRIA